MAQLTLTKWNQIKIELIEMWRIVVSIGEHNLLPTSILVR